MTEGPRLFDPLWLARTQEEVIDPGQIILDPHHHVFPDFSPPYGLPALQADLGDGHAVAASVYMEALTRWHADGPAHLRPTGETAFAATIGEAADRAGGPRIAAAIVAHGQFALGDAVQDAIEAHIAAGRGRLRGLRANLFWDDRIDLGVRMPPRDLCATATFRDGFARLAPLNLRCDIFAFAINLPAIARLAGDFPDTPIVIDHCGGPIGCSDAGDDGRARFDHWRAQIRSLAERQNVHVKIGGLGGSAFGPLGPLALDRRPEPTGSTELAEIIRPYFEECLAAFGSRRALFESNFPIDKRDYGYGILWNAFKRLARPLSETERDDLFWRSAARFYGIDMQPGSATPKAIA